MSYIAKNTLVLKMRKTLLGLASATLLMTAFASQASAVEVQEVTSDGGITAWLIEDHLNPLLTVDFAFKGAGSATDPAGKAAPTSGSPSGTGRNMPGHSPSPRWLTPPSTKSTPP